jgi:uncharacterized membrane protein
MNQLKPEPKTRPISEILSEQRNQNEASLEIERLVFFSDAVIAIAITLLAISIGLPAGVTPENLPREILNLMPQFGVYALSFIIIGNTWVIHHRIFRNIKRYDSSLIWINNFFLLCVAFLPVPSRVFGLYPTQPAAIIFFNLSLIVTGLMQAAIWYYATEKHRLIDPTFSPALIRWGRIRNLIPIAVQLLSIALSFFSPLLAILSWALIWVGFSIHNRHYPRRASS